MEAMSTPEAPQIGTVEVLEHQTVPTTGDGDHERFSHIIKKDDEMKGYVMGEPVIALCGKKWVPTRDPQKFPVCPTCIETLGRIRAAGSS